MVSETKISLLRRLNNITNSAPLSKVTVKQIKGVASIQEDIAKSKIRTSKQLESRLMRLNYLPFFKPKN